MPPEAPPLRPSATPASAPTANPESSSISRRATAEKQAWPPGLGGDCSPCFPNLRPFVPRDPTPSAKTVPRTWAETKSARAASRRAMSGRAVAGRTVEAEPRRGRFGRGDDTVGNPHRAQIFQFDLFELILLLKLHKQFPVEQFEATVSQSAVPSPPPLFGGSRERREKARCLTRLHLYA